jgi:hypothetical protein
VNRVIIISVYGAKEKVILPISNTNNSVELYINVILTGATGMVGEGVLLECLANPEVKKVLVVGRRPSGYTHLKLEELIHSDLEDLSPAADRLAGYDACFFCAGVSSIGKNKEEYSRLTYDMTIGFAETFKQKNPGTGLSFCYVSGYGTDSTVEGKSMWARVKGRTENKLIEMFGAGAFMFRPGYLRPTKGQKHVLKFYFGWQVSYPVMKLLMSKFTCTLKEVGNAMINAAISGYDKRILEVKDIVRLSKG